MRQAASVLKQGRLDHDTAEIIVTLLAKKHPDIALSLDNEYREIMPDVVFSDYALIPLFLQEFCRYQDIEAASIKGRQRLESTAIEHRKQFMAVLLMCYHPEKILQITQKKTWQGLEIFAAHYLDCSDKSLSYHVPEIISWFHIYPWFAQPVQGVHQLIIQNHRDKASNTRAAKGFTRQSETNQQLSIF